MSSRLDKQSLLKKGARDPLTCKRYSRKAKLLLDFHDVTHCMTRAKNYGIADESLLKLLDLAHFVSLEFHTAVMMEYALEIRKTNSNMYHSNKAVKVLASSSLRSWGISRASVLM